MKLNGSLIIACLTLLCFFGFYTERKSNFSFKENSQGIELLEKGRPVFFYQREPKSSSGQYVCNNYLHPLFSIDGDTITDEFPADHLFHRGIFWAWHQIFIDNQSVGDGWVMQNITQDVFKLQSSIKKSTASLDMDVHWKSSAWQNGKSFVHEHTTILVHQMKTGARIIDFEISLRALVPGVNIGGSDDEKGYGGFSLRLKHPEDMAFISANGTETPQAFQIKAGPWMDFNGSFGTNRKKSGLTLICHSVTPNYPAPWILRRATSMQNVVFPGRQRIELPVDRPVVLKYRIVLHKGGASDIDIAHFQAEYEQKMPANL